MGMVVDANRYIIAGTDSSGQNLTTMVDTTDLSERTLIDPTKLDVEIYHLNLVALENKVMFDGLRFSDNKYVIGYVDLNTMNVVASPTGSGKFEDFQTF